MKDILMGIEVFRFFGFGVWFIYAMCSILGTHGKGKQ